MDIIQLKKKIPAKYFDYQSLKAAIEGQVHARRYIGQLIRKGYIVRIKKGLYVWGQQLDYAGYAKEIPANLIYGPSYISLEYALSFYGLIPERVETVTSVTFKKNKIFKTPIGSFEYCHTHKDAYTAGVIIRSINPAEKYLIATPEKALLDCIALRVKKIAPNTQLSQLVNDDMRIDQDEFANLNIELLVQYGGNYRSGAIKQFITMMASQKVRSTAL